MRKFIKCRFSLLRVASSAALLFGGFPSVNCLAEALGEEPSAAIWPAVGLAVENHAELLGKSAPDKAAVDEDADEDEDDADDATIVGNVALASDYVLRGFSLTDHQPALQGGFDWRSTTGIYVGVWGSNVHFLDSNETLELDESLGYRYQLMPGFSASLGVLYLAFFENDGRNSFEIPLRLEYQNFSLEAWYSPDWQGEGASWYFRAGFNSVLFWQLHGGVYIGVPLDPNEPSENQPDARVQVSREFLQVEWEIAGIITQHRVVNGETADPRMVFSMTQEF